MNSILVYERVDTTHGWVGSATSHLGAGRAASLSGKMPLMTNRGQPGAPKRG